MFHIKEDKRSRTSAWMLIEALEQRLQLHPFEEISITEVCKAATVSRATFYRLFDTLADVVAYRYECFAAEFSEDISCQTPDRVLVRYCSLWMSHTDILEMILRINREDILFDCHRRHMPKVQKELQKWNPEIEITEYHVFIVTGILIGVIMAWIREGKQESAEQVVRKVRRVLRDFSEIGEPARE